jgi:hypothetical protein
VGNNSQNRFRWEWLIVSVGYCLVALFATYPLVQHLTETIPYVLLPEENAELLPLVAGDHLQTYYWFWLFKDNLIGQSPFFSNPYEFHFGGRYLQHGYAQFPVSILFFLLSVFGNVPAHNLLILLTYVFSGLSVYYLVRSWGLSAVPSFIGGLVFALAPSRQTQLLAGHINGYVWFLIPLTLYFFEKGYRAQRYGPIVLSGLCILCLGMVEPHLLYFFLLFLCLYLPARILGPRLLEEEGRRNQEADRSLWPLILVLILGILSGMAVYWTRTLFHQEKVFGLIGWFTLGFYALLFYFSWLLTSQLVTSLTGQPLSAVRKKEALTYLPALLLLLAPFPALFPLANMRKGLFLLSFVGIIFLKFFFHRRQTWHLSSRALRGLPWRKIIGMVLVIALFISLAAGFSIQNKKKLVGDSIVGKGRTWQEVTSYSPEIIDLFKRFNASTEGFIYPGWLPAVLLLFLLVEIFLAPAAWSRAERWRFCFFSGILISSYAIALGAYFDPVLPVYRFMYDYFPFFKYPRDPARIIFLSFLCWGIIVAFGLEGIRRLLHDRMPGRRTWPGIVLAAAAALVLWDYHPQKKIGLSRLDEGNPVYQALSRLPAKNPVVMGLPLFPGDSHQSSLYEYYMTQSRVPMVNGYSPVVAKRYVEEVFWPLIDLNVGEISRKDYEHLRQLGVTHLVHHQELYFFKVSPFSGHLAYKNLMDSPYLKLIMTNMEQSLFEVLPPDRVADRPPVRHRESTGVVLEVEETPHSAGKVVDDPEASMKKATRILAGQSGKIAYNAYRFFPSGKYQALFRVKALKNDSRQPLLLAEVVTLKAKKPVARKEISGRDFRQPGIYQRFLLPFEIQSPEILEFRLYSFGRETISADKIVVSFADLPISPASFGPLDIFRYLIKPVQDPETVGGWVLRTNPAQEHPGYVVYGPYQTYPPGAYQARFRLKRMQPGFTGPLARIDVSAQRGTVILNQQEITGRDFGAPDRYREFILPFRVKEEEELEFRIFSHNISPFQIDRIVVEKTGTQP